MAELAKKVSNMSLFQLQEWVEKQDSKNLQKLKLHLDDVYYNTGEDSGVSDMKYDLVKEVLSGRPGYKVNIGAKIREGENRARLPYWLGSMDKIRPKDTGDFARWLVKNPAEEYIVEDKLDGVSCLLVHRGGEFKIFTRGDGIVGADISYLRPYFRNIPQVDEDIVVRGELIMNQRLFEKKYSKQYANPRNMVAGRIGGKTVREGLEDIEFIAYEIISDDESEPPLEQLRIMDEMGFKVVKHELWDRSELIVTNLIEAYNRFSENNPFEMDGLIVQPNMPYERNIDGNPDYAFAFKLDVGDTAETVVEEVIWNVSKNGFLKPRLKLQPVKLSGAKISYATGFNAKYIKDNSIGPGSVVEITRSGDVIPFIVRVVESSPEPQFPDVEFNWNESGVDIVAVGESDTMCIKIIASFFTKLGIKHVSEATVEKMYNHGLNTLLKIIDADVEDFLEIDTFKQRLAERTYNNIHEGLQDVSVPTVLGASGVFGNGIGRKKVEALFHEIPDLLDIYADMDEDELMDLIVGVEGFSGKTADKIVENLKWADKLIDSLRKHATFKDSEAVDDNLKGYKIVLSGFRDAEMEKAIGERGGKVVGTVSKNTSILVVPKIGGKSTGKIKKAEDLGVTIYERDDFTDEFLS